jgi:hypothetical protein
MAVYFLNRTIPPKHVSKTASTWSGTDDITIFLGHNDNAYDPIAVSMSGADVPWLLVTDAHKSSSIRYEQSRETLRFPFYVSRLTATEALHTPEAFAAFSRVFFLHVFTCVGVLAVFNRGLPGYLYRSIFHPP